MKVQTAQDLGNVQSVPCGLIRRFEDQPRKYFDEQKMRELIASIREFGQKVPGILKVLNDGSEHEYELVDGERRWRACTFLGEPFKAWIQTGELDPKQQFLDSIVSNFGRDDHAELEILEAIIRVRKDFDLTLEQTAAVFGRSVGWVQQYLSLQKLDSRVLAMLSPELPEVQRLTFSHALLLVPLNSELQFSIATTVIEGSLKLKEVKYLVEKQVGLPKRNHSWSPREEFSKFQNFLRRSMIDLGIYVEKKRQYFDDMFKHRAPKDLADSQEMVESVLLDMAAIKEELQRVARLHGNGTGRK